MSSIYEELGVILKAQRGFAQSLEDFDLPYIIHECDKCSKQINVDDSYVIITSDKARYYHEVCAGSGGKRLKKTEGSEVPTSHTTGKRQQR